MSETSMYNVVNSPASSYLIGASSFLQVTRTAIKSRMSSKFDQARPRIAEIAAIERLKTSLLTYNGRNVGTTLTPLNESSSFL